ncbi:MAG: DUF4350 domain-containing protein [Deltaproteobacteria bacterium]|nr:DUF4350 domain-containing protein [Deltaproteobacteria bacterium]
MTLFMHRCAAIIIAFTVFLLASPAARAAGPVVLFDQSHGQQFLVETERPLDLSGLAAVFVKQGAEIKTTTTPITDDVLKGVNVLIISGPFAPITPPEVLSIMKFVYHGGKLAVMAHIAQPLTGLLPQMGVAVSNAAVAEQENIIDNNPKNFQIKDLTPHPLTEGLKSFNVYGGWALLEKKKDISIVARTTHKAWVDLNQNGELNEQDAVQAFSLVLAGKNGSGEFVVFGDDAIFQNQFLQDGNLLLAKNLAKWFCGQKNTI